MSPSTRNRNRSSEPRSTAVDKGALVFVMFPPYPKNPVPQHFTSPLSRMAQTVALAPLPEPADTATDRRSSAAEVDRIGWAYIGVGVASTIAQLSIRVATPTL